MYRCLTNRSVKFLFCISVLPRNIKTLYAVIGRPPLLAGVVQLTFMEVASMPTLTVGEPGASEGEQNSSPEIRTYDLRKGMEWDLG